MFWVALTWVCFASVDASRARFDETLEVGIQVDAARARFDETLEAGNQVNNTWFWNSCSRLQNRYNRRVADLTDFMAGANENSPLAGYLVYSKMQRLLRILNRAEDCPWVTDSGNYESVARGLMRDVVTESGCVDEANAAFAETRTGLPGGAILEVFDILLSDDCSASDLPDLQSTDESIESLTEQSMEELDDYVDHLQESEGEASLIQKGRHESGSFSLIRIVAVFFLALYLGAQCASTAAEVVATAAGALGLRVWSSGDNSDAFPVMPLLAASYGYLAGGAVGFLACFGTTFALLT